MTNEEKQKVLQDLAKAKLVFQSMAVCSAMGINRDKLKIIEQLPLRESGNEKP